MTDSTPRPFSLSNLRAGGSIYLLAALLLTFIAIPVLNAVAPLDFLFPGHDKRVARLLLKGTIAFVLVTAALTVAHSKRPLRLMVILTAFPIAVDVPDLFGVAVPAWLNAAANIYVGCALLYVVFEGGRTMFRLQTVSANMITLALCAYLLIGLAWSYFYQAALTLDPATAFDGLASVGMDADRSHELFYFSFVTFTTLGYGEITPGNGITRSLALIQAIVGQMFVAVFLARLVGLQVASAGSRTEECASDDQE